MTPTAFESALTSAQTAVEGYIGDIIPVVGAIGVAVLGIAWLRRAFRFFKGG